VPYSIKGNVSIVKYAKAEVDLRLQFHRGDVKYVGFEVLTAVVMKRYCLLGYNAV
jgi:hypothetical protein